MFLYCLSFSFIFVGLFCFLFFLNSAFFFFCFVVWCYGVVWCGFVYVRRSYTYFLTRDTLTHDIQRPRRVVRYNVE